MGEPLSVHKNLKLSLELSIIILSYQVINLSIISVADITLADVEKAATRVSRTATKLPDGTISHTKGVRRLTPATVVAINTGRSVIRKGDTMVVTPILKKK